MLTTSPDDRSAVGWLPLCLLVAALTSSRGCVSLSIWSRPQTKHHFTAMSHLDHSPLLLLFIHFPRLLELYRLCSQCGLTFLLHWSPIFMTECVRVFIVVWMFGVQFICGVDRYRPVCPRSVGQYIQESIDGLLGASGNLIPQHLLDVTYIYHVQ